MVVANLSNATSSNSSKNRTNESMKELSHTQQADKGRMPAYPKVDFNTVAITALRKYKKQYRMRLKPGNSKSDLVDAVSKHFANLPPPDDEMQVIRAFASAVRQLNSDSSSVGSNSSSYGSSAKKRRQKPAKSS